MPLGYLQDNEKKIKRMKRYIHQLMEDANKTQTELASLMGIEQPAFCKKLKNMKFTTEELIIIFHECKAEPYEVGERMCDEKN